MVLDFLESVSGQLQTVRELIGSVNTSAFIGTNPGDLRITSALPVILPQLHETMFANLLQSLLRSSLRVIARCCSFGTFLWTSALDAILMAGNPTAFKDRLVHVLGDKTFVLPTVDPSGQPRYTVGEVAGDVYEFRSKIAHGQLIPKKFFDPAVLKDVNDNDIRVYTPYGSQIQYHHVIRECALFLLVRVLRKIFLEGYAKTLLNAKAWRTKLNTSW